jgi:phosphate transport system permease protein
MKTNRRQYKSRFAESALELMLLLSGFVCVLATAGVIYVLLSQTWAFFQSVSLKAFFLDTVWTPLFATKRFGIWSLVAGSVLVTVVAMLTAGPFGILSAIFMSEYASARLRKYLKPCLEILAGIPTIVYGYFALTIVTPALMKIIPGISSFNALSAGLVMGIMLIPTISSLCEDALFNTPRELKEAAYSLGARKLSTNWRVVLPSARGSIIAALFLAFGRSMGETMIVSIAAGLKPDLTLDVRQPIETMTAYIVQVSMGDTPQDSIEYLTIFAVGTMLFLLTFIFHWFSKMVLRARFGG